MPLYAASGEINQILLVENNISEQKQAEREMVSALTKEHELNELKSRFVSMASHEFRTPLATILSSVSLISRYAHNNDHEKTDTMISLGVSAIGDNTDSMGQNEKSVEDYL